MCEYESLYWAYMRLSCTFALHHDMNSYTVITPTNQPTWKRPAFLEPINILHASPEEIPQDSTIPKRTNSSMRRNTSRYLSVHQNLLKSECMLSLTVVLKQNKTSQIPQSILQHALMQIRFYPACCVITHMKNTGPWPVK